MSDQNVITCLWLAIILLNVLFVGLWLTMLRERDHYEDTIEEQNETYWELSATFDRLAKSHAEAIDGWKTAHKLLARERAASANRRVDL